jgi:hypothetical protein
MNLTCNIPLCCAALCLLLTSCSPSIRQLQSFKEFAAQGNWQRIAAEDIVCKREDDACSQLHLIKGDACYRLAKQHDNPQKELRCAAEELELGIQWTSDWNSTEVTGNRGQYQENWCESLRLMRSEQTSSTAAIPYNEKMLVCARGFAQISGQHQHVATYFLHNAELAAIRFNIHSPGSCQALLRLQEKETAAAEQAALSPYAHHHQRLLNDIVGIRTSLPGCP